MTRRALSARTIAGGLVFLAALTSAAPPAAAEPKPEAAPIAGAPLTAAAVRAAENAPSTALAQTTDATSPSDSGFMSTSKGRFLAVLFVAGVSWAIYSAHHDREPVRSPVR